MVQLAYVGVVVLLGLGSRRFASVLPAFLGKYPGDALWALLVFALFGLARPRASTLRIGLYALATSYIVEVSQLYEPAWLVRIRHTTLGHLVLGTTFNPLDLVAYTAGVAFGMAVERLTRARTAAA
jgi:hypothetical protein